MNAGKTLGCLAVLICAGCADRQSQTANGRTIPDYEEKAVFNGDSAFVHVARQVDFGPRVPGTDAHEKCLQYIVSKLNSYGADTIILQSFNAEAFNGDILPLTNVTARYNPDAKRRILLAAHWDTRPWADHDINSDARRKPIPGANDGGSGVAVLLEIARQLQTTPLQTGVDLVFFDGEDYGDSERWGNSDSTWCLGSQYWADNKPYKAAAVTPEYAIVFDMVGGKNAKFHREVFSDINAKDVVDKVWSLARRSGMGASFVNSTGGSIIDDHLQINRVGIPSIVIIESNNPYTQSFNPTWHTQSDDMSNIDRKSLRAAGQTVLNLLYEEDTKKQ